MPAPYTAATPDLRTRRARQSPTGSLSPIPGFCLGPRRSRRRGRPVRPGGKTKGAAAASSQRWTLSLVDAALICKEFPNLRHVIECGLLSGLFVRPDRCRWPRWRCADRGQISESELEARRKFLVRPTRIMSIICPCSSCLPHNLVARFEPYCRIRQRFRSPGRDSLRRASASPRCRAPSCWPEPRRPTSAACVPACAPARDCSVRHGAAPTGSRPLRR